MMKIFRLLRPHQYIKNGFVWLGVVFSQRWDAEMLVTVAAAFVAFCAAASAVYIFNDIWDVESDRQHPVNRYRPIARGEVSVPQAWMGFVLLLLLAAGLGGWVGPWNLGFLLTYVLLNVAYSWRFKHVVILDVFIISAGFMLRILTGTMGVGIEPSQWLLLTGLMLTLFLGFTKRRAELLALERAGVQDRSLTRRVLDEYSPMMIEHYISISAACTIMSYSLYTVSADTIARHGTDALIYTVPFVAYGIYRYIFLLHQHGKGNDTARDLYADPHLLIAVMGWVVVTVWVLV